MKKIKLKERQKKSKSIFEPVKEQLEMLLEYINILEGKKKANLEIEINFLMEILIMTKKQCLIYLNNYVKSLGNNNGRNYTL